jgi:hypothetical protein
MGLMRLVLTLLHSEPASAPGDVRVGLCGGNTVGVISGGVGAISHVLPGAFQ